MRVWAFVLSVFLFSSSVSSSFASVLGPVSSYKELLELAASASDGDTILVSGEIKAESEAALSTQASIHIQSLDGAAISGLSLSQASVSFSGVTLSDSLSISGTSHVQLGNGVRVTGSFGRSGVSFSGDGTLIVEPNCSIEGGEGSNGLSISHSGGEFYASIEGSIRGGSGNAGGAGVVISPLKNNGAVMITGSIEGGRGDILGGHALNLYDLSGNAFITVAGSLQGGGGSIGGDGIQLVSAQDSVNVGINGRVKGGSGENYGGNALILMNAEDSSSFHISGYFAGGDVTGENAYPGTSLHLVGDSASLRARIDNCILEDGRQLKPTASPVPSPTPTPDVTPLPQITAPADNPAIMITPEPTSEPTLEPTIKPTVEPTAEPTVEPTAAPTAEPTLEPTIEPTAEPTAQPAVEPTEAPAAEAVPEQPVSEADSAEEIND